jgi:hypothetical protein
MNRIVAWSSGAALFCLVSTAAAETPFTEEKVQLAGNLGFGFAMDDDDTCEDGDCVSDMNPYGFGIGAQGGYTLGRTNFYFGGLFQFYFGDTEDTQVGVGGLATGESNESANLWLLQGIFGYDFGLSRSIVLRPELGLGMTQLNTETCIHANTLIGNTGDQCEDDSDGKFSVSLGAELPIDIDPVFISPSVRMNLGDNINAFILGVAIGGAF